MAEAAGIAALTERFRIGAMSPVEALGETLARIEAGNGEINAIYYLDPEAAYNAARASEIRWRAGRPLSQLDGVPMSIKDALATVGMPAYRGSAGQAAIITDTDHPAVRAVREAGVVIFGKNTMCDYGILGGSVSSKHGVTRNPADLRFTAGASSSGAGASIAAGFEPASIGTDIVGSIRLPAAFCGIAGLKPTRGLVPHAPPNHRALVVGPMGRRVEDVALLLGVLARPDSRDFTSLPPAGIDYAVDLDGLDLKGLRINVLPRLGIASTRSAEIEAAVISAGAALERLGANVELVREAPLSPGDRFSAEAVFRLRCREEFTRLPAVRRSDVPYIDTWSAPVDTMSALEFWAHEQKLLDLGGRVSRLLDDAKYLILPVFSGLPFAAELPAADPADPFEAWADTFPFNLSEQPAATVPWARSSIALPIGIQVVGRRFDDRGVLQICRRLEELVTG